jgi:DNA-binding PadR family transcriptional regulator
MSRVRSLTELEGTVLGVVWSCQPCTPYQVRREFTDSPSPQWSGSAGAIYPLMARLEASGLVRSHEHATGSRNSRLYQVTAKGRKALARWIGPPVPGVVAGVPPDPLRTRVAFMTVLAPDRRLAFLEEAEARVVEFLEISERGAQEQNLPGPYHGLMVRGAIAMQRTRLRWIREALELVRREGQSRKVP